MFSPPDQSLPVKPYQCCFCFKSYKRREHLQRHQLSHVADRPHQCPTCAGAFQRADVLRRHLRTCIGTVRQPSQGASRRRACDRCVQQKKACNNAQPCRNCSKRGASCLYTAQANRPRVSDESPLPGVTPTVPDPWRQISRGDGQVENMGTDLLNFPELDFLPSADQTWQDLFNFSAEDPIATTADPPFFFHFLDTFTSKSGFVSSFECGTLKQRHEVLADIHHREQQEAWTSIASGYDETSNPLGDVSSRWLNDPLALQTHQILLLIKEVVTIKPRNSSVNISWSQEVEQRCVQFFSPANLRKYIDLYWSIWSPNVNFLHRPSFDAASSKPVLLACMAVIGACVSPAAEDCRNVRMWLNCVEEATFADDDFNRDPISPFQPVHELQKIQALQAAYMVSLYQNWEGTDASKKRIRRHRFSTVLSMVRDIDIATARHANYNLQQRDEFDWKEFVAREELIRTFIWVFLMDTAFVTFNNLPPRMVAKEMKMHVAAPESCFQAPSADRCFEEIQQWMPPMSLCWKASFRSLFESLCVDDLTGNMRHFVAALGPLNLFTIISGIHSLVFQYQSFFSAGHPLVRTRNALQNFKDIWHLHQSTFMGQVPHTTVDESHITPKTMWQRVGFCRHAGDFWLLAKIKVDRLSAADAAQNGSATREVEDIDPILNKYDQTSMRQVNDLISEFQKVRLGEITSDAARIP